MIQQLVKADQLGAGVIGGEDFLVVILESSHALGAKLAHAHSVSPAVAVGKPDLVGMILYAKPSAGQLQGLAQVFPRYQCFAAPLIDNGDLLGSFPIGPARDPQRFD